MSDETKYQKAYLCLERDCGCLFRSEHDGAICPDCGEQTRAEITPVAFEKIRAHFVAEYCASLGSVKGCTPGPWEWSGGALITTEQDPVFVLDDPLESEGLPEAELASNRALVESVPSMAAEIKKLRSESVLRKAEYVSDMLILQKEFLALGTCENCRRPLPADDAVRDCLGCDRDGCIRCIKDDLCVSCAVEKIESLSKRDWLPDSPLAGCGALCAMCAEANGDDINEMWNEISERRADSDADGNEIEDLSKSHKELLAALKFFANNTEICHKHEPGDVCVACELEKAMKNAEALQRLANGE